MMIVPKSPDNNHRRGHAKDGQRLPSESLTIEHAALTAGAASAQSGPIDHGAMPLQ
jgi:hypothetical protein